MADSLLARFGGVTLTQLAYAVAVDTHRHFGAAAAACHVAQPTLSMQLRKLERALGGPLFDRTRTPVLVTPLGRGVVARARVVLEQAALLAVAAEPGALAGEVRLGVIPTLAPHLLPELLLELSARHSRLTLVVEERITAELVQRVEQGALDGALVASPVGDPVLAERVLFHEPFVAYVSASHRLADAARVTAADLSLDDLWLLADGHCLRAQAVSLCRRRDQRGRRAARVRLESGTLDTLRRLVERCDGMTLLPALAAADLASDAERARVRAFAGRAPGRDVRLVRRRDGAGDVRLDAIAEVVRALARGERMARAGVTPA